MLLIDAALCVHSAMIKSGHRDPAAAGDMDLPLLILELFAFELGNLKLLDADLVHMREDLGKLDIIAFVIDVEAAFLGLFQGRQQKLVF